MRLDLLVLVSAFATAEGFFVPNSIPARLLNPTDLRYAGQQGSKPSQFGGPIPFAQFTSVGIGTAAALRQMCKYIQEGCSLRQLVYKWAPPSDGNNSENYLKETIRRIESASGITIDPEKPLHEYLTLTHIA